MTQGERVNKIRKENGLTLEKFGERLGVTKVAISNIEKGNRNLTEQMAKSICREFNVNPHWLSTGEGEMLISTDRNADLAKLTRNLLDTDDDSYKKRLISVLANLTEDQWQTLADIADKFAKEKD